MMENRIESDRIVRARRDTLEAGRILRLLRFQAHPDAPVLAPGISTYANMMDPNGDDASRLKACRRYMQPVREQILAERLRIPRLRSSEFEDPYGVELQTTQRGLLLIICDAYLLAAVREFESIPA